MAVRYTESVFERAKILHDSGQTWLEVAESLSKELGGRWNSDTLRKHFAEQQPTQTVEQAVLAHTAKADRRAERSQSTELLDRITELDRELRAALQIRQTPQTLKLTAPVSAKVQATAIAVYSDWHCEETVLAEKVNGLNKFNLDIADRRITNCFNNTLKLYRRSAVDTQVDGFVLALLGDFISGNIHASLIETVSLQPAEAIRWVQERILAGIRLLLKELPADVPLTIVCHCGNHPRLTQKVHDATEQGNSLEYLMYHNLRLILGDEKINWVIAESYHTYLDLYGFKIRFHHGHKIRFLKAIGGMFMSAYRQINEWNKAIPAWLDVFGHLHQQRNGNTFIANGSLIGTTPYSLSNGFAHERPRQKFFMFSSSGEVIGEHPIFLD